MKEKNSSAKSLIKKIIKWSIILVIVYFIVTTLLLGHSDIDSKKGIYNFYWSGLNALWQNDKPFGFKIEEPIETSLDGFDGPHVFGDQEFFVNKQNELQTNSLDSSRTVTVHTNNSKFPKFVVQLKHSASVEKDQYVMPEKLIAISDIEGNFNGFYSFLLANKVMDEDANWIFGDGHLVLNGDFFDRGDQVTQVLWLIYHLENQAIESNGKIHFVLGNHEIMNLYGDVSHNDYKYIEVAKQISSQAY